MAASPVTTNGNNTLTHNRRFILVVEEILAPTPKIGKRPTDRSKPGKCRIRTSNSLRGTPEEVLNSRYLLETPQDRLERADKMDAWNAICLAPSASKACKGCSLPCKDLVFRLVGTPGLYICTGCIWRSTEPHLTDSSGFLDQAVAESFEETRKLCYGDWATQLPVRTTNK
jgi:hypothetical protein